ncbi:transposase [Salmonella enterica]|uniref:Transposase n=1 Tax=Salmonella enterica subsp. enterica serovar Eastbourne TaxID=486993 RepID=A0A702BAH9_SALET|nr:transposase [Salmonella enterica]ECA1898498.1 transposase [Salmonella enterica subsp. enterica serovar Eastbourne]HAC6678980.1 transposase [Salmonella enterica subsp. enterica serovar Eastbourne]HAE5116480.1 transposase [Salmonella enterica subsp. enterica serovar Eastbourne]
MGLISRRCQNRIQLCIVHMVRNSLRFVAWKDYKAVTRDLKGKRLARTVLIFTESSDQLSRATDRVPGLLASPGYAQ